MITVPPAYIGYELEFYCGIYFIFITFITGIILITPPAIRDFRRMCAYERRVKFRKALRRAYAKGYNKSCKHYNKERYSL